MLDVEPAEIERLRASEAKYRALFDGIDQGVTTIELIYDDDGRCVDCLYLESNAALERLTGLQDVEGKRVSEVIPGLEPQWLERYARIVETGRPERFVDYVAGLDRWFEVYSSRVGGDGSRQCVQVYADVTATMQAERAAHQSAEELRYAIEANPYAMWTATPAGEMDFSSDRWKQWVGSDTSGTAWQDVQHPDDLVRIIQEIVPEVQAGRPVDYEHRVRFADGAYHWMRTRAFSRLNDRGEVVKWYGTTEDIEDRKQAAAALRDTQEQQRLMLSLVPVLLWSADPSGAHVAMNESWAEYTGQSIAAVQDFGWLDAIHPDDLSATRAAFEHAFATGEPLELEHRIHKVGDGYRWHLVRHVPVRDGHGVITRWFGAAIDIDEMKRTRQALRESEQWLQTLMRGVPQLVWRAVGSGEWTWASPQWTEFTGQSEVDSHQWGWLDPVHPDDRDRVRRIWAKALDQGEFTAEYRLHHADEDRYRWFQTRATPVRNAAGAIIEWLGTSTNIDDIHELQQRQEVLVAELQHRVRNILTVVRSVFSRTIEVGGEPDDIADHFRGRLDTLARTQVIVTRNPAGTADLEELIRDELLSVGVSDGERVTIDGPDVALPAKMAESIGLAIHELTTNALKYGALKGGGATLAILWSIDLGYGGERHLSLSWQEQGVPAVAVRPTRRGFGSELIEEALPYRLGAETKLEFLGGGIRCTIDVPLPEYGAADAAV